MAFGFRKMHRSQWLSGGVHFAILAVAAQADSAAAWPWALLAMAGVSFAAWAANYRRYRQVHDLPTSKVASAAQGYAELLGRGEQLPGAPLLARLSRQSCCWYSFQIHERGADGKWKFVDRGTSVEQFLLVDDTGSCVISPDGAEVVSGYHRAWQEGDRRYTEDLILPGGPLYAVGEFTTVSAGAASAREERADIAALIADWKSDPRRLHERFDLDRDGSLDIREWELARMQAAREVRRSHAEAAARSPEGVHLMRKPRDGRLYLLADEMPGALGARFRYWSWAHLAVFLGAGIGGLVLL
ncbi:MAG: hypothetical protein IT529_09705 [Burkholderiales bacterium]|nr:hypothetical protein [Burkholderiales bacterium]